MTRRRIIVSLAALVVIFSAATTQAGVEWAAGAPSPGTSGGSLSFDGDTTTDPGTWVDTGVPASALTDYTVSLWLNQDNAVDNTAVNNQWFVGHENQGIHLGVFDTDKLRHAHWGADTSGTTAVTANTWIHATFTYDADGGSEILDAAGLPTGTFTGLATTYFNGVGDNGVGVDKRASNNTSGNIILGSRHPAGTGGLGREHWIGDLDDVAIWDSVLPATDILSLANGTQNAVALGAGAYWDFEDDQTASTAVVQGSGLFGGANISLVPPAPLPPIEPAATGNWNVRGVQIETVDPFLLNDVQVNDLAEAKAIMAYAGPFGSTPDEALNTNFWTITEDAMDTRGLINLGASGSFPNNEPYPMDVGTIPGFGGQAVARTDFIITASTDQPLVIPEGTYALAVFSDDGAEVTLNPTDGSTVAFSLEQNTDASDLNPNDNTIAWGAPRGAATPTCAEFTVAAGTTLTTHIDAIMYERGGGDGLELVISNTATCSALVMDAVDVTDFVPLTVQALADFAAGGGDLPCDFDGDGNCDHDDIDTLYDTDGAAADISGWLSQAEDANNLWKTDAVNNPGGASSDLYVIGDVNLDGDVNSIDLGLLLNNFNNADGLPGAGGVGWGGGDLTADGMVNSVDLGQLLNNFNFTSASVNAVPEPNAMVLLGLGMLSVLGLRRRR